MLIRISIRMYIHMYIHIYDRMHINRYMHTYSSTHNYIHIYIYKGGLKVNLTFNPLAKLHPVLLKNRSFYVESSPFK